MSSHFKLKLVIEKFRILKDLEIPFGQHNVLYGVNNGGKSTIIHALINLFFGPLEGEELELEYIRSGVEEASIELKFNATSGTKQENVIRLEKGYGYIITYEGKRVKGPHHSVRHIIEELLRTLGVKTIAYIAGDKLYFIPKRDTLNIWDVNEWRTIVTTEFIDKMESISSFLEEYFDYYIEAIHPDKFKVDGKWIVPTAIPYGFRRAIAVMYATLRSDIVLIEGFENSLHIDLIKELMEWLNENAKLLIIETHSGLVLQKALSLNWIVHYIDKGRTRTNIGVDDLRDLKLFKTEWDTYRLLI